MEVTQEYLQSIFDYSEGFLYWKIRKQSIQIGDKAGCLNKSNNRHYIRINGRNYLSARLIFLYHNGYLPKEVDHEDRNKMNNKIGNLRPATRMQNARNRNSCKNSTSKYKGVNWHKKYNKWRAAIEVNSRGIHLGNFKTEEEAALVYNKAAVRYFGEFAGLNIIQKI